VKNDVDTLATELYVRSHDLLNQHPGRGRRQVDDDRQLASSAQYAAQADSGAYRAGSRASACTLGLYCRDDNGNRHRPRRGHPRTPASSPAASGRDTTPQGRPGS
jgi:hypothetical protein